jgi:hypothetical protein
LRRYIDLLNDTKGFSCRLKVERGGSDLGRSSGEEREIGRPLAFISLQIQVIACERGRVSILARL